MTDTGYFSIGGLGIIMGLVLLLPFSVKRVEEELELFLLVMGIAAVSIAHQWHPHLVQEALREPLLIAAAVLIAGLLFKWLHNRVASAVNFMTEKLGLPATGFLIVLVLGLASSLITAIIAALVLCEVVSTLKLDRKTELHLVIYACFAIGLGAALTPIGEPLSTIVVSKLKGPPHNAGFGYLFSLVGCWIVPGVLLLALMAARRMRSIETGHAGIRQDSVENTATVFTRAGKVYVFVMALVLLGAGLKPLAEMTVAKMSAWQLYWINIVSAALDNATLAAAEIVPDMSGDKITAILMGLLVAGGILIPGNIPNIISASKLNIRSREWAAAAAPLGLALMAAYFFILMITGHMAAHS